MLGILKKTAYKLVLIGIIIFAVNAYIDYKIEKLFENFKVEQAEKVTTAKDKIINGGFLIEK